MTLEESATLKKGDDVTYCPTHGHKEKGVVKKVNGETVFVVYNCNEEWHHYEDYTACATNIRDLKMGWIE